MVQIAVRKKVLAVLAASRKMKNCQNIHQNRGVGISVLMGYLSSLT
jgi:hypothetical protein